MASISPACGASDAALELTASVAPRHMQPDSFSHPQGGSFRGLWEVPSGFISGRDMIFTTSAALTWHSAFDTSTSSAKAG